MSLITAKNVEKIYGKKEASFKAVNNVNLEINKGEFIALVGSSGCGKSSLLHILGAMDTATKGEVIFEEKKLSSMKSNQLAKLRLKRIGFIFQTFNLIPTLSVIENVTIAMKLNGYSRGKAKKRALELLEKVGLSHRINYKPTKISGGEKQRVAIARALANNPAIILADEPTGNLDSKNGKNIMQILFDLNKQGHTIVMVTHNPELAEKIGKIIRMKDGRLV